MMCTFLFFVVGYRLYVLEQFARTNSVLYVGFFCLLAFFCFVIINIFLFFLSMFVYAMHIICMCAIVLLTCFVILDSCCIFSLFIFFTFRAVPPHESTRRRANLFFGCSIADLESQMIMQSNGAGCAARGIIKLQFGALIDPFCLHLMLIDSVFVIS